ncbi:MAG: hypothetical protein ACYTGB_18710 [Planctomycetota bacterium]|jgi:hypothetical protein
MAEDVTDQGTGAPAPAGTPAPTPPAAAGGGGGGGGTSFLKVMLGVLAGGCLLIVIVAVVGCAMLGSCAKQVQENVAREDARLEALPVSPVTWEEIEGKFGPRGDRTHLQKQDDWKNYRGKKVRWTGTVLAVSQILGTHTLQVQMNPNAKLRTILVSDAFVALKAGEEEKAKALALKPREQVTFEAILDHQNVHLGNRVAIVTLKRGRIVE